MTSDVDREPLGRLLLLRAWTVFVLVGCTSIAAVGLGHLFGAYIVCGA